MAGLSSSIYSAPPSTVAPSPSPASGDGLTTGTCRFGTPEGRSGVEPSGGIPGAAGEGAVRVVPAGAAEGGGGLGATVSVGAGGCCGCGGGGGVPLLPVKSGAHSPSLKYSGSNSLTLSHRSPRSLKTTTQYWTRPHAAASCHPRLTPVGAGDGAVSARPSAALGPRCRDAADFPKI